MRKYIKTEKGIFDLSNLFFLNFEVEDDGSNQEVILKGKFKQGGYHGDIFCKMIDEIGALPKELSERIDKIPEEKREILINTEFRKEANKFKKHMQWILVKFIEDDKTKVLDLETATNIYFRDLIDDDNNSIDGTFKIPTSYY